MSDFEALLLVLKLDLSSVTALEQVKGLERQSGYLKISGSNSSGNICFRSSNFKINMQIMHT